MDDGERSGVVLNIFGLIQEFRLEKDPMIDQKLYVGGIGMEYVLPNGAIASEGGKFVKIIDHKGSSISSYQTVKIF